MNKIPEVWKKIPNSEQYELSNYGNVRRLLKNGKVKNIKNYVKKNKWVAIKIKIGEIYKERLVHKLMEIWLDSPTHEGMVLWHKNGLITDNYAGNLEWITRKELGKRTGGKTTRNIAVIQIDLKTGQELNWYKNISAAARDNYIHKETICQAIRGQLKTAGGYKWKKSKDE